MSDSVSIPVIDRPITDRIRPPGSKSITNRALACAAAADGVSTLVGALDSDDVEVMVGALKTLGLEVAHDRTARTIAVAGCGGRFPAAAADLFIGNSGTTVRFLTALLAACGRGRFRLHGTPRMHERPIQDLIDAVGRLGGHIRSEAGTGCPPVVIDAAGLDGGEATVRGDVSSQFLSGLLMAAPFALRPLVLTVEGSLVSRPYVAMTLDVMRAFGVDCPADGLRRFAVPQGRYRGRRYEIEPDASAASYWFAAAAITGGTVTVEGLHRNALQGDVAFVDVLARMGCEVRDDAAGLTVAGPRRLHGIDVDMNAVSDTVQTLAVVALFADGPTRVRGVAHIRHKETDRIRAPAVELRKLGARVDEFDDGLCVHPPAGGLAAARGAEIDTYEDHRMAMSFALAGLRIPGIVIRDPGCVRKTYPEFFADLERLIGASLKR